MSTHRGPNPLLVGWSVLRALRIRRPQPAGAGSVDHADLAAILSGLQQRGVAALPSMRGELERYRNRLERVDPDELERSEALAFWLNLYNAGALDAAAEAVAEAQGSVLRVPGAFRRRWTTIAGEGLSLDAIEHGKIRRFGDPRIHGSLVCGSASCPTLRYEPFAGPLLDAQLDDQMAAFLTGGGAVIETSANVLALSRIFLWYGADFVRPHRMPAWLPVSKKAIADAITPWLDTATLQLLNTAEPTISFQSYDWSLACSIR